MIYNRKLKQHDKTFFYADDTLGNVPVTKGDIRQLEELGLIDQMNLTKDGRKQVAIIITENIHGKTKDK